MPHLPKPQGQGPARQRVEGTENRRPLIPPRQDNSPKTPGKAGARKATEKTELESDESAEGFVEGPATKLKPNADAVDGRRADEHLSAPRSGEAHRRRRCQPADKPMPVLELRCA